MNNPLVSIVVPIYNMGDKIELCVKSILCQDYSNYEVILVDDGSQDNSLEVCNRILILQKASIYIFLMRMTILNRIH